MAKDIKWETEMDAALVRASLEKKSVLLISSIYEQLTAEYPSSEWTKRAYPYRLL
ncbi:MAG: hypothetical protein LWW97_05135 [Deltaproteobacteria bacterium]|nr:hypothetical protein [Deltaproteobacteria bacterium]